MLPSQRDLPRNDGLDLRTGKIGPSAGVNLVFDP